MSTPSNPYSDAESFDALRWRYDHDPLFHALVKGSHAPGRPLEWWGTAAARSVQRVLNTIEQLGLVLAPAVVVSPTAQYSPDDIRMWLNPSKSWTAAPTPLDLRSGMPDGEKVKAALKAALPQEVAALIPPTALHEGGEFTMQDLVDYHAWDSRVARPGRYACNSTMFRLLSGENAPYRCAQCGTDIRDEQVEAWVKRKNSTGAPSGE